MKRVVRCPSCEQRIRVSVPNADDGSVRLAALGTIVIVAFFACLALIAIFGPER